MKNVAVFFGGNSVEHDVSIITGVLTLNSLDKERFVPVPIFVSEGKWLTGKELFDLENYKNLDLSKLDEVSIISGSPILYKVKKNRKLKEICAISIAINCMHGDLGEDGSLVGMLNFCDIPSASPNVLASSIAMDKYATKIFLKGLGIKCLHAICTEDYKEAIKFSQKIGFPVIVKPYKLGSSIGVEKVEEEKQLLGAINNALRYGEKAIVEKYLTDFIEINCACYRDNEGVIKTSWCERPIGREKLLSFEDKYSSGQREFPANIPNKIADKIRKITAKVYKEGCFNGIIRIDYFISGEEVILNEINAIPGSLAYYLFSDTFKGFKEILNSLIDLSESQFAKEKTYVKKFSSTILNINGAKSSKRL